MAFLILSLSHSFPVSLCSLGYGGPGVRAVHVAEYVRGLDSGPRQEASVQTSAVGAVSDFHGGGCWWRRPAGTQRKAGSV